MIILQAKFVGKSSLGFESGENYNLNLLCCGRLTQFGPILISTNSGTFPGYKRLNCEYSTIEKFFENWEAYRINNYDATKMLSNKDSSEFESLLYSNMRDSKISSLI